MKYITRESEAPQVGCYSSEDVIAFLIAVGDREVLADNEGVRGRYILTHIIYDDEALKFKSTTGTRLAIRQDSPRPQITVHGITDSEEYGWETSKGPYWESFEDMVTTGLKVIVRYYWGKGYQNFYLQPTHDCWDSFLENCMKAIEETIAELESKA